MIGDQAALTDESPGFSERTEIPLVVHWTEAFQEDEDDSVGEAGEHR